MYKLKEYRYIAEDCGYFTKGKLYYTRVSKDGEKIMMSTDKHEITFMDCKLSISSARNAKMLVEEFEYTKDKTFKNYTAAKLYLKTKENKQLNEAKGEV